MSPKKSGEQEGVRREGSVGASWQANPVRRSQRVGQDQAKAARATGAGATDALTGGGANSSSTTGVKEENPALSNRGPRTGHGSPALRNNGPREDEFPVPSVGGPVLPPKRAVAFPYPALSTSGPRVERTPVRERAGIGDTHRVWSRSESPHRHA